MDNIRLCPINHNSEEILKKNEFALIGVSPFNSYFSTEKIARIIKTAINEFEDFAIFIPDQISGFTLKALGYEQNRIHHKVRKQDNYLNNKVTKALSDLADSHSHELNPLNKIVKLSSITNNTKYIQSYNLVLEMFNTNKLFARGCTETSSWILLNHRKDNALISKDSLSIAVQYFLKELPIFLSAPEILNVKSCCFIYTSIPQFLEEIYNDYNMASKNQGFAIIEHK
jgi:cyclo(L-tyrosyl-L-tyrosyl) synthase